MCNDLRELFTKAEFRTPIICLMNFIDKKVRKSKKLNPPRGQLISKAIYGVLDSPKNEEKDLT